MISEKEEALLVGPEVKEATQNQVQPYTHFLSIPLTTPEFKAKALDLQKKIQSHFEPDFRMKVSSNDQNQFHITLSMLTLKNEQEIQMAQKIVEEKQEELRSMVQNMNLNLKVNYVRSFTYDPVQKERIPQDETKDYDYIFLNLDSSDTLQLVRKISDLFIREFIKVGIIKKEDLETMMLQFFELENAYAAKVHHITLLKIPKGNDLSPILEKFTDFRFGLTETFSIDLSTRGEIDEFGYYYPAKRLHFNKNSQIETKGPKVAAKLTHFLCLPLISEEFKASLSKLIKKVRRFFTKEENKLIHHNSVDKANLNLGMLSLLSKEDEQKAKEIMKSHADEIRSIVKGKFIDIKFASLSSYQFDSSNPKAVYKKPFTVGKDQILFLSLEYGKSLEIIINISDILIRDFIKAGFIDFYNLRYHNVKYDEFLDKFYSGSLHLTVIKVKDEIDIGAVFKDPQKNRVKWTEAFEIEISTRGETDERKFFEKLAALSFNKE